jgi:hypothetical protein
MLMMDKSAHYRHSCNAFPPLIETIIRIYFYVL